MKTHMILLLTLFVPIISNKVKRITKTNDEKKVNTNEPLNITNWKQHGLEGEISRNELRALMEYIAKFSSIKTCPLGNGKCDYKSIDYVLPRLIRAMKKTSNHDATDDKSKNKIGRNDDTAPEKLAFGPPRSILLKGKLFLH